MRGRRPPPAGRERQRLAPRRARSGAAARRPARRGRESGRDSRRTCAGGSRSGREWLGVALGEGADATRCCRATTWAWLAEGDRGPRGRRRARQRAGDSSAAPAWLPETRRRSFSELCPARRDAPVRIQTSRRVDLRRLFDCRRSRRTCSNRAGRPTSLAALYADYLGDALPEDGRRGADGRAPRARGAASLRRSSQADSKPTARWSATALIEMPLVPGARAHGARRRRARRERARRISASGPARRSTRCRPRSTSWPDVEFLVDSPKQLAEVLFEKMGLPARQADEDRLLDRRVGARDARAVHPIAEKIVEYRELTKLKSTYLDALPRTARRGRPAPHVVQPDRRRDRPAVVAATRTCRTSRCAPSSGAASAPRSFPRRRATSWSPRTTSQIELRILAHLSGDEGLIEAFTSGVDFHRRPPRASSAWSPRRSSRSMRAPGEGGQLRHRLRAVGPRACRVAQASAARRRRR